MHHIAPYNLIRCHLLKKSSSNTRRLSVVMNSECLFAHLVTGSAARKPTNFRWKQQSEEAAFRPLSVQTHKEWVPRHLLSSSGNCCSTDGSSATHSQRHAFIKESLGHCPCDLFHVVACQIMSGCTVDSPWISFHIRLYQKIHPGTALPIAARNGLDGLVSSSSQLASALAISKCMQHLK